MDRYDDLQASYGRCLRSGGFIERFYDVFLGSDPRIAPLFATTDFQLQRMALRRGISMAISHAGGMDMVKRSIDGMALVHSRKGRAPVPPELYHHWVESLLFAIREKDPEATPRLVERWRTAMKIVTAYFTAKY